ncbi:MAG: hypothetical protein ROO76_15475 [Terriglobia bacterium]|nr:hypothetical protein [Terriglobia bacterium]
MKRVGFVRTAVLIVLLVLTTFCYAMQEQQGDKHGKPDKQSEPDKQKGKQHQKGQNKKQEAQQQQRQNQDTQRAQKQDRQNQDKQRQQSAQQQQRQDQDRQRVNRPAQLRPTSLQQREYQQQQQGAWHQYRARTWESEHRNWQQRGGYNGYRIDDSYFRTYYGRNHWFRVYHLPFMVADGYPRFQYNGYWFSFVDPYPEYWGDNWYETDDVYVDYVDDGYYLYNRRYPDRPGITINISF